MFDRNGYASATLGRIAESAGMSKGALYFHFASKDGLADAVQEQGREMLSALVASQRSAGLRPVQALIDMTHWLVTALYEDPVMRAAFRITNECTWRQPPVVDFYRVWITEVQRLVRAARESGDMPDAADEDGPEVLLSVVVCGIEALHGTGLAHPNLAGRVAALWEALLPALVPEEQIGRYRTGCDPADFVPVT